MGCCTGLSESTLVKIPHCWKSRVTAPLSFQCALATAVVNIKLPLMVGEVVNVISEFAKDTTRNFIDDIKKPALRLIATYLIQVMEVSNFIDDIKKLIDFCLFCCFPSQQL